MVALVLVRERGRDIRCVLFLPAAGAACCGSQLLLFHGQELVGLASY